LGAVPPDGAPPEPLKEGDIGTALVALEVCATIQDEQQGGDGSAALRRVAAWLRARPSEPGTTAR
jgi:hypothetical protein